MSGDTSRGAVEPSSYGDLERELKEARFLLDDGTRKLVAAEETLSEIGDAEALVKALKREAGTLETYIVELVQVREQEQTKAAEFEFVREYIIARANTRADAHKGLFANSAIAEWEKMSTLLA